MKECSLNHFTESLAPWLNDKYIRNVILHDNGQITFSFKDGINDTYQVTDCDRDQLGKICHDLVRKGISVQGLQ